MAKVFKLHSDYVASLRLQIQTIKQELKQKKIEEDFNPYSAELQKTSATLIKNIDNEAIAKKAEIDRQATDEKLKIQTATQTALTTKRAQCEAEANAIVDVVCSDYLATLEKCGETIKDI